MASYDRGLVYMGGPTGIFQDAPYGASYEKYPSFGGLGNTRLYYDHDFRPARMAFSPNVTMGGLRSVTDSYLSNRGIRVLGEDPLDVEKQRSYGPWIVGGIAVLALGIFWLTTRQ